MIHTLSPSTTPLTLLYPATINYSSPLHSRFNTSLDTTPYHNPPITAMVTVPHHRPTTNHQPRTNRYTRAGMVRVVLVALFTTVLVLSVVALSSTSPLPLWKQYPFVLVPSDPERFTFPEAEGGHNSSESDSWFITAHLTGLKTGKSSISSSLPAFFTKDDHRHTVSFCQHL